MSDPIDDDVVCITEQEYAPIHPFRKWLEPGQQSNCGGYCYLCSNLVYREEEEQEIDELPGGSDEGFASQADHKENLETIDTYITVLVKRHTPLDQIVQGIYSYYNKNIRKTLPPVMFTLKDGSKKMIEKPEWSRETILNHLTQSADPRWAPFFDDLATVMLRKAAIKASEVVVDAKTGRLIHENTDMLHKCIREYDRHRESVAKLASSSKRRKVSKM